MYYAEGKIQKALPKMIKAAQDDELKSGLEKHLEETGQQLTKLEEAFELLGEKAKGEKCDAIDGILKEGDSLLKEFGGTAAGGVGSYGTGSYGSGGYGSGGTGLASTGIDAAGTLGIAGGTILAGALLTALVRRRRTRAS